MTNKNDNPNPNPNSDPNNNSIIIRPNKNDSPNKQLSSNDFLIDSKAFLLRFAKLGKEVRNKVRGIVLEKQRQQREKVEREEILKHKLADQKNILKVDWLYSESDHQNGLAKLIQVGLWLELGLDLILD
jgi:hypothetical protein